MSAQNARASRAAASLGNGSPREVVLAALLLGVAVTLFAASGLHAGGAPLEVAGASACFAWLFIPCVVLGTRPRSTRLHMWSRAAFRWRAATALILTVSGAAAYLWAAPRLGSAAVLSRSAAIRLVVFEVAIVVVTLVRPIERVGYTFALDRHDLVTAGVAFAAFAALAIPLGLATGFIHYGWRPFDALAWAQKVFYFYFQVALPEELLFRGLLQNGFERLASRRWPIALALAALLFGAAHMGHPPVPNWRYGILATLAGLAYGWVWHRTGKITAAALTHAAVDLVWVLALGGP